MALNIKIALLTLILVLCSSIALADTTIDGNLLFSQNDSTIKLTTDTQDKFSEGQSIELHGLTPTSKPSLGFYSYDPFLDRYMGVGWIVCHYNLSNGNTHQHCSFETLDNSTGTPDLNSHFEIGYGSNVTSPEIKFPGSTVIFSDGQRLYFGNGKNSSIRFDKQRNTIEYNAPQHRFTGGNVVIENKKMALNGTGTETFLINRGSNKSFASFLFATAGKESWAIQTRNDGTDNLYVRNTKTGNTFLEFTETMINFPTNIRLIPQTQEPSCTIENRGMIYFDNTTSKHRGCNGTQWNNLY